MIRTLILIVLSAAALGQTVIWARRAVSLRHELTATRAVLADDTVSFEPARLAPGVQHALPGLATDLPPDARVLLVSGHPLPVQFEHLFLPRPFRLLQRLEPGVFTEATSRWPDLAEPIERARRRMERLGLALTPERLADGLAQADVLVTFLLPDDWAPAAVADAAREGRPPPRLQRLDGNAWATVWRLAGDG